MSNQHFKNKSLSLKAKGLLSLMLSLPDDWNYNMQGLTSLSRDGIDSVRSVIKELEHHGYVQRNIVRNEYGCEIILTSLQNWITQYRNSYRSL